MKKVALVFVLAVLLPSLVLAWLAARSLRDQQFLLERQQSLLDQRVTDTIAQNISEYLEQRQQEFASTVEMLIGDGDARALAVHFDDQLRRRWPLAEVGFCVTTSGTILSPQPNARPAAQMFRLDNSGFLGNREPVEVYWNANSAGRSEGPMELARGTGNAITRVDRPQVAEDVLTQSIVRSNARANSALAVNGDESSVAFKVASTGVPTQAQGQLKSAGQLEVPNPAMPLRPNLPAVPAGGNTTVAENNFSGGTGVAYKNDENISDHDTLPQPGVAANGFLIPGSAASGQQKQPVVVAGEFTMAPPSAEFARPSTVAQPTAPAAMPSVHGATALAVRSFGGAGSAAGEFNSPAMASDNAAPSPMEKSQAGSTKDLLDSGIEPKTGSMDDTESNGLAGPAGLPTTQSFALNDSVVRKDVAGETQISNLFNYKAAQNRAVSPQSAFYQAADRTKAAAADEVNVSKVVPAEAEFGQLIGSEADGMLARFLQNKLKLMFWHRLRRDPNLIFGAQLNLPRVVDGLHQLVQAEPAMQGEICLAVLDDNARPEFVSRTNFSANWKRPFVATEIGDALPHWEVAAYLVNPAQLTQAARTARLTLGLLVAMLLLAIGIGSWLIVRSLNAELKLARQKTDFVSNVSHELKTPLTSIRMFSELLAEGRVSDATKRHSYQQIISAEAARLTRLINNILDFSRMERGEKKYNFQPCDLVEIVRATAETFRPHFETNGFKFECELPEARISARGDADALSQIIVNLLSNAEKYSNGGREVILQLRLRALPLPHAEIRVSDRGSGVPRGSEEKIFEKFYRAHDSLGGGIQGSGLGLTIARQIARAHGGDVVFEPREGGGSCFILRLPIQPIATTNEHE